jgi:hypothetical protein
MPSTAATFTHTPVLTPPAQPLKLGGRPITELCELYLEYCHQLRQMKLDFLRSCFCPGCEAYYKSAKAALESRIKELHNVLYPIFLLQTGFSDQAPDRRKADKVAA